MARRTVIWHIGPVDPGTEFLAPALREAREELADLGIATPSGAWHETENQIWKHKGVSVLSTPGVARADQAKVSLRLNGLRDLEVHLVLLVRDLPTQVYAAWQEQLRQGGSTTLKEYTARVLDPARSHCQAEEFWAGRDLAQVLPLWTRAFHPERVHVVAAPDDADTLWQTLLGFADVEDVARPAGFVPPSLRAEVDPERVLDITTSWAKLAADRGFDQQGSLMTTPADAPTAAGRGRQLVAVGTMLAAATAEVERLSAEVAHLRAENARLDRKRRKHKRRLSELRG